MARLPVGRVMRMSRGVVALRCSRGHAMSLAVAGTAAIVLERHRALENSKSAASAGWMLSAVCSLCKQHNVMTHPLFSFFLSFILSFFPLLHSGFVQARDGTLGGIVLSSHPTRMAHLLGLNQQWPCHFKKQSTTTTSLSSSSSCIFSIFDIYPSLLCFVSLSQSSAMPLWCKRIIYASQ